MLLLLLSECAHSVHLETVNKVVSDKKCLSIFICVIYFFFTSHNILVLTYSVLCS